METFLISDTHFGHKNIVKFTKDDGSPLRPWDDVEEMNQALVDNWNSVVGKHDKVYHLGDATMDAKSLQWFGSLNGRIILIKGNHDIQKLKYYTPYFDDIRGAHEVDKLVLTHIPIEKHFNSMRYDGNIHGHTHQHNMGDPWYYNVSVEQINYTPINFEVVRQHYYQG